jgi:rod shape determining protein RodA
MKASSLLGSNRLSRPHFDWPLAIAAYLLAFFGVLAVTVTNYDPALGANRTIIEIIMDSPNGRLQLMFVLISLIAVGGMMSIDYQILGRLWPLIYGANVLLLVVVLGTTAINEVKGWFSILDRTVQPAELAKVAIIISLSKELTRHEQPIPTFKYFVRICIHIGVPLLLITLQPDIGTMLVFVVIFMALLLISGWPMKYWWTLVICGIAACVPIFYLLSVSGNWRWQRIIAFLDPEHDSTGSGFQIINSKIAVGSGGADGVGLFSEGTLTHLNFVPENHTDFIFSSIGETMGFFGSMILLALYAFVIYRMLILSYHTGDRFGRLVIVGVASMLIFHMFENIGMNIGVMPITGIPLPFVSYGGSNLIANMAGIGLVLNVTMRKPMSRSLDN